MEITKNPYSGEVQVKTALDFVQGLRDGKTPQEAANAVGMPLPKLLTQDLVKSKLEELKHYYIGEADARKKAVIAKMVDILLNGDPRDSVAAAKVLTSDPDLGFNQTGPTVQVNILTEETRALAKELDEDDLWGTK